MENILDGENVRCDDSRKIFEKCLFVSLCIISIEHLDKLKVLIVVKFEEYFRSMKRININLVIFKISS